MRLLADEHIDNSLVDWLREQGHDVTRAVDIAEGQDDESLVAEALRRNCVVLTCDKGFGELILHHRLPCPGVILLRLRVRSRAEFLTLVQTHWPHAVSRQPGQFVTVTKRSVRARRLP